MISEEIKNGMELLDERAPELLSELLGYEIEDWRPLIDRDKLNLQFCTKCILGQLFGHYDDGLELLGLEDDYDFEGRQEIVRFGFALPMKSGREAYEELTNQWKQALLKENQ